MNLARQLDLERLALLLILKEASGYEANSTVLRSALGMIGYQMGARVLLDHLSWLADIGLVREERLEEIDMTVATLTARGLDVACGVEMVEGVARPAPGK
jgi:hypothetical protein